MSKEIWRPGNMLYPLPSVLVTVADDEGNDNVLTVAWTGTVCSDPAMVYVSVRPSRYSHHMIKETGEFVINLTTEELAYATDYCGVKSGKEEDKFKNASLTKEPAKYVKAPLIKEGNRCCSMWQSRYVCGESTLRTRGQKIYGRKWNI